MALVESAVSILVLIAAVYLGLKIVKNIIVTAVLVAALLALLWYTGYLVI